jgi:glutamate-1-semialdehyde 2,1-aminomutase
MHRVELRSAQLFERGQRVFPGGVTRTTVVRHPRPIYVERGEGPWLIDVDGNRLLDLNANFTTLIHGHAFKPISDAVAAQLERGTCFANPTEHELALAELICGRIPAAERIRFVNTGTEAVMFALKAARAFTGRSQIAKLEGTYHGGYDWAEISEHTDPSTSRAQPPIASSNYRGAPQSVAAETIVLALNDVERTSTALAGTEGKLAAILIDVMPSRCGLIPIEPEYLALLSDYCRRTGTLLISDEVLNLRQDFEGASARFGIKPDLMTMGKIIGGGLPIGAIAGRRDVMEIFAQRDSHGWLLPQGGTFSANPLSMVAGLASMQALDRAAFAKLEALGDVVREALNAVIARRNVDMSVYGRASLFRIQPSRHIPRTYREAFAAEGANSPMPRLCEALLRHGVNLPRHGTGVLSTPMTDAEVSHLSDAFSAALADIGL